MMRHHALQPRFSRIPMAKSDDKTGTDSKGSKSKTKKKPAAKKAAAKKDAKEETNDDLFEVEEDDDDLF